MTIQPSASTPSWFKITASAIILLQILILILFNNYTPFSLLGSYGRPPLLDMKNILSAIECCDRYEVLKINPCDMFGRPMNYPRVWLAFPFNLQQLKYLFITLYALYCMILYYLFLYKQIKFSVWNGVLFFYFIFSPVTQLLLIRMNNDWIIFILIFLFVYLRAKKYEISAVVVLLAAIVLKLYPIVLVITLLDRYTRKNIIITAIAGIACLFYFWFIREDIKIIGKVVPSTYGLSYGFKVMIIVIQNFLEKRLFGQSWPARFLSVATVAGILILYCRFYVIFLIRRVIIPACNDVVNIFNLASTGEPEKKMFVTGSLIFVFTYLLGANYDYRLVYLVLIFPFFLPVDKLKFSTKLMLIPALICFFSKYSLDYLNDFLFVFPVAIFLSLVLFRLGLQSMGKALNNNGGFTNRTASLAKKALKLVT